VYSIFIRATPEQIWDAITKPEFTRQYYYGSHVTVTADSYSGLGANGQEFVRGSIVEYDPPRRFVQTWRSLWDPALAGEEESRVTWEIEPGEGGVSRLTVVHDRLEGAPKTAEQVAGGWMLVLSGLKTLLETGKPLAG
jgi:uncharacterized protein YndB with AHSA1/START domain